MFRIGKRQQPQNPQDPLTWHIEFVVELAKVLRPNVYVELGVHRADLFNRIIPFAGQLVGVDTDPQTAAFVQEAPNVRFVRGTTDEFVEGLRHSPMTIDMLFIDADHRCESVIRDFRGCFPFVRQQGLILLHDTHPGDKSLIDPQGGWCGDAYRAIGQLQVSAVDYEMMTIPVSPGLTLCRKRKRQLSWEE
jgi:predicted O-methyltransferase YrrM